MLKIIEEWLAKPSGRYQDGLAIFSQLAPEDIKKKYLNFFQEVEAEKDQFDTHFTMLINKVSAIAHKIKVNPKVFENVELILKTVDLDSETQKTIEDKNLKIAELKEKLQGLKSDNQELISENEDLNENVEDLESDLDEAKDTIEEYESQIADLETEINELKAKRGIQIVALKDMPEDLQKKYERNQQITPLMAKYHADMSVEGLHPSTREKTVKLLLELDDERRQNWEDIDAWSEGRQTEDFTIEVPAYDADPTIAGAQMARRVERLKENIARSKDVADKSEKETIKVNALKRIETYESELAELTTKLQPTNSADTETKTEIDNSKGADE